MEAVRGDERRRVEELLEQLVVQGERLVAAGEAQLALVESVRAELALSPSGRRRAGQVSEPRAPLLDRTLTWQRRCLEVKGSLLEALRRRGVAVQTPEELNELLARHGLHGLVTAVIQEVHTLDEAAARLQEAAARDPAPV